MAGPYCATQGGRSPFPPRVMPRIAGSRRIEDREVAVLMGFEGRVGLVLRFLLGTGLRWAEACRARSDHVRGVLLEISSAKSGRVRRVPLSPTLLDEVRGHDGRLVPYAEGSPGQSGSRATKS